MANFAGYDSKMEDFQLPPSIPTLIISPGHCRVTVYEAWPNEEVISPAQIPRPHLLGCFKIIRQVIPCQLSMETQSHKRGIRVIPFCRN